jgi:hypothetical protein
MNFLIRMDAGVLAGIDFLTEDLDLNKRWLVRIIALGFVIRLLMLAEDNGILVGWALALLLTSFVIIRSELPFIARNEPYGLSNRLFVSISALIFALIPPLRLQCFFFIGIFWFWFYLLNSGENEGKRQKKRTKKPFMFTWSLEPAI